MTWVRAKTLTSLIVHKEVIQLVLWDKIRGLPVYVCVILWYLRYLLRLLLLFSHNSSCEILNF